MATYTLPAATTSTLGGVIVDGVTITVDGTGKISAASSGSFNSATLTGTTTIQHAAEIVTTYTGATGTVVHDYLTGSSVYLHTNVASNFTVNFTNMPTVANRSYTFTLIVQQGGVPYLPNAVSINSVSQVFYWNGITQPTPTALKQEFFTFSLLYTGSNWLVTGALNSYG
jgi:hypothetical protein